MKTFEVLEGAEFKIPISRDCFEKAYRGSNVYTHGGLFWNSRS